VAGISQIQRETPTKTGRLWWKQLCSCPRLQPRCWRFHRRHSLKILWWFSSPKAMRLGPSNSTLRHPAASHARTSDTRARWRAHTTSG